MSASLKLVFNSNANAKMKSDTVGIYRSDTVFIPEMTIDEKDYRYNEWAAVKEYIKKFTKAAPHGGLINRWQIVLYKITGADIGETYKETPLFMGFCEVNNTISKSIWLDAANQFSEIPGVVTVDTFIEDIENQGWNIEGENE